MLRHYLLLPWRHLLIVARHLAVLHMVRAWCAVRLLLRVIRSHLRHC